jgi:hypothetical protein
MPDVCSAALPLQQLAARQFVSLRRYLFRSGLGQKVPSGGGDALNTTGHQVFERRWRGGFARRQGLHAGVNVTKAQRAVPSQTMGEILANPWAESKREERAKLKK